MGKSKKNQPKKAKKEKIVYVDDGRTIADMSGVGSMGSMGKSSGAGKKTSPATNRYASRGRAPYREHLKTYWEAVKLMFFPMLVVLAIIAVAFLIVYVLL